MQGFCGSRSSATSDVMGETYVRLPLLEQKKLLDRIVERCRTDGKGPTPVVVFDLDGTLMDNRPRTARILRELGVLWREREPAVASKLEATHEGDLAYLL